MDFELDHDGIARFLTSDALAAAVHDKAEEVAASITDVEVVVDDYTTDRSASSVTITDPRGVEMQARDGVLTKAAAAAGLEVKER